MHAGLHSQVCFRIQHIGNCVFFTCGVDHYPRGDRSSLPTAARDTLLTSSYNVRLPTSSQLSEVRRLVDTGPSEDQEEKSGGTAQ